MGFKPFSRKSHNEFNDKVIDFIKNNVFLDGYHLEKNADDFDIDVLIKNVFGQTRGFIEGESHGKHWDEVFPFDTVNFLGRKLKYVRPNAYYVMTNFTGKSSVMIPFERLATYKIQRRDTAVWKNDSIIEVPNEYCIWGWEDITKYISEDLKTNFIVFKNS